MTEFIANIVIIVLGFIVVYDYVTTNLSGWWDD